jgi:hypothetical protein
MHCIPQAPRMWQVVLCGISELRLSKEGSESRQHGRGGRQKLMYRRATYSYFLNLRNYFTFRTTAV